MIIRKKYKFEAAHKVRNCPSNRCSKNIHGHSFIVEVLINSDFLDNGDMVMDFGLLKPTVGKFLDWFDHSLIVWNTDEEMMAVAQLTNERICILPFNATAENMAKVMYMAINNILANTKFTNGEVGLSLFAVKMHETATGYAECDYADINKEDWEALSDLRFSHIDEDHPLLDLIRTEEHTYTNPKEILG